MKTDTTWTIALPDEAATERLGRWLGEAAARGDALLLEGDLGAGKTTLARGLARGLGVEGPVTSPTFTLLNEYGGRLPFFHFDLYRVDPRSLPASGLMEYWDEPRGVCAIEWPARLRTAEGEDFGPEAALVLALAPTPDGGREARLDATAGGVGGRALEWLAEVRARAARG